MKKPFFRRGGGKVEEKSLIEQQLDSKQIYNLLLPTIKKIYEAYSYINISFDNYNKIVGEEINEAKKKYQKELYSDYIIKKIKIKLNKVTKNLIYSKGCVKHYD